MSTEQTLGCLLVLVFGFCWLLYAFYKQHVQFRKEEAFDRMFNVVKGGRVTGITKEIDLIRELTPPSRSVDVVAVFSGKPVPVLNLEQGNTYKLRAYFTLADERIWISVHGFDTMLTYYSRADFDADWTITHSEQP